MTTAEIAETTARYSLFLAFAEPELIESVGSANEAVRLTEQLDGVLSTLEEGGVEYRGAYDTTGFGVDSSVFMWLRADNIDDLQWAQRQLQRTIMLADTIIAWSAVTMDVSEVDPEPRLWLSLVHTVDRAIEDEDEDELAGDLDLDEELDLVDELAGVDAAGTELDGAAAEDDLQDGPRHAAEPTAIERAAEATSLHAQIGVGPITLYAAVEVDDPFLLVGPSLEMLDSGLTSLGESYTGRRVTTAELYEILR